MTITGAPTSWVDANQRYMVAAIDRVRVMLELHAGIGAPQSSSRAMVDGTEPGHRAREHRVTERLVAAEPNMPGPATLETVSESFGLSPFERDILVLCAAVELDGSFPGLCASAQGDPSATHPTFGLALATLPDAHWSALTPVAPLRAWRLVSVGHGIAMTAAPVRIEERVLHHLVGVDHLDERLEALVEVLDPVDSLPSSHEMVAERIVRTWEADTRRQRAGPGRRRPLVQLCGPDAAALRDVAAAASAAAGLRPFVVTADAIPQAPEEREALVRLWERDAVLGGLVLVLDCGGTDPPEGPVLVAAARVAGQIRTPVIVLSRDPLRAIGSRAIRIDLERPPASEQRRRWEAALVDGMFGDVEPSLDRAIDHVVGQFDLGTEAIDAAAATFGAASQPLEDVERTLWDVCRWQARPRLDDLAQRVEPVATWDDLVLPDLARGALADMAIHARHRTTVYDSWGFAALGSRGLGISALFAGASGTGKTMAAEVLANELRLDLYRIDLSCVISKYIGETEKNLRRVFDAAEQGGAILLFDEADALFGKRSEVKDSHDRYANIEVSYLLQRMEAFRGLAILTTNLKSALDAAFLRRIRFVVQFPFPEPEQRAEIWRRIFPATTPVQGLDVAALARLNVAGGSIRNIAVGAAFLAADARQPVRMHHLLRAVRSEYAKLEKPLTAAELAGWPKAGSGSGEGP